MREKQAASRAGASRARHSLTLWQLDHWKRGQARAALPTAAVAFAPVHVVETDSSAARAGIGPRLARGNRLFIPADASPDLARAAITALRPSC